MISKKINVQHSKLEQWIHEQYNLPYNITSFVYLSFSSKLVIKTFKHNKTPERVIRQYMPDFIYQKNGITYWIEVKGYCGIVKAKWEERYPAILNYIEKYHPNTYLVWVSSLGDFKKWFKELNKCDIIKSDLKKELLCKSKITAKLLKIKHKIKNEKNAKNIC